MFLHYSMTFLSVENYTLLKTNFLFTTSICFEIYFQNRSGAEVGDLCNKDFDGDGFPDDEDSCPHVDNIHKTSFLHHFIVWLDGQSADNDVWKISNEVIIS